MKKSRSSSHGEITKPNTRAPLSLGSDVHKVQKDLRISQLHSYCQTQMWRACSREISSVSILCTFIPGAKKRPYTYWKRQKWKCVGCFPSPNLILPEPGQHFNFPDDIYPALKTCFCSQDGLPKATVHQEGPLEDRETPNMPEATLVPFTLRPSPRKHQGGHSKWWQDSQGPPHPTS